MWRVCAKYLQLWITFELAISNQNNYALLISLSGVKFCICIIYWHIRMYSLCTG